MTLHCFFPFAAEDRNPIGRLLRTAAFPLDSRIPEDLLATLERLATARRRAVAEIRPVAAPTPNRR